MSLSAQFQAAVAFGPQGQYGVVADQAIMNRIMRDTTLGDAMTYTYDLADAADCYKYEQFVAQIGALLENNATLIVPVRRVGKRPRYCLFDVKSADTILHSPVCRSVDTK